MPKYEVIRPWNGVKMGDILELDAVHSALATNVRLIKNDAALLHVASPNAASIAAYQNKVNAPGRPKESESKPEGRRGSNN